MLPFLVKISVLTCTRTLGRAAAIKKEFGGVTVCLFRNLFQQWASYSYQFFRGNTYFIETIDRTLKNCRHDHILKSIDDWFSHRKVDPSDKNLFLAFLLLHLYLEARAYPSCDLVIDVNRIAADPGERRAIEIKLSEYVGDDIQLSDVRPNFEYSDFDVELEVEFLDTIEQFMKLILGACDTASSRVFVENIKNDALEAWQQHEFYNKRSRRLQAERIAKNSRAKEGAIAAAGAFARL